MTRLRRLTTRNATAPTPNVKPGVYISAATQEALLRNHWSAFAVAPACVQAVARIVRATPSLGPSALSAAILHRVPAVVARLLPLKVAVDAPARDALLADGAKASAVFYVLSCSSPPVGDVLVTVASRCQKCVQMVLTKRVSSLQGWRAFVKQVLASRETDSAMVDALVRLAPPLGPPALFVALEAECFEVSSDDMEHTEFASSPRE